MDEMMSSASEQMESIAAVQAGYEAWCNCVRRLLGWSDGVHEDWPAMFASGHTPRDAARAAIYGDGVGD